MNIIRQSVTNRCIVTVRSAQLPLICTGKPRNSWQSPIPPAAIGNLVAEIVNAAQSSGAERLRQSRAASCARVPPVA